MVTQCGNPSIRPDELVETQAAQRAAGFALVDYYFCRRPDLYRRCHGAGLRHRRAGPPHGRGRLAAAARGVPTGLRYYTPRCPRGRVRPSGLDGRRWSGTEPWPGSPSAACTTRPTASRRSRRPSSASSRRTAGRRSCVAPPCCPATAGINLADHRLHRRRHGRGARARAAGVGERVPLRAGDGGCVRASGGDAARRSCRRRPDRCPVSRPARRHGHRAPATTARASCSAGCARSSADRPIVGRARPARQPVRGDGGPQRRAGRLPHLPAHRSRGHRPRAACRWSSA